MVRAVCPAGQVTHAKGQMTSIETDTQPVEPAVTRPRVHGARSEAAAACVPGRALSARFPHPAGFPVTLRHAGGVWHNGH
jgi:hypothetical protein